ncbi:hypothetical protein D3C84_304950 [compost metagenome]
MQIETPGLVDILSGRGDFIKHVQTFTQVRRHILSGNLEAFRVTNGRVGNVMTTGLMAIEDHLHLIVRANHRFRKINGDATRRTCAEQVTFVFLIFPFGGHPQNDGRWQVQRFTQHQ